MPTKQQRKFRKEIRELKKQRGNLYNDIYNTYTSSEQSNDVFGMDYTKIIKVIALLVFVGLGIYKYKLWIPLINNERLENRLLSAVPSVSNSALLTTEKMKKKKCSDYIQIINDIDNQTIGIINRYTQRQVAYEQTKEQLEHIIQDLKQLEIIEHGQGAYVIMTEKMLSILKWLEFTEELYITRTIKTKDEKILWQAKYEQVARWKDEWDKNTNKQYEEIKKLLKEYNINYKESTNNGIEYYY